MGTMRNESLENEENVNSLHFDSAEQSMTPIISFATELMAVA